jgi:glutamyl-tRNA synthetase
MTTKGFAPGLANKDAGDAPGLANKGTRIAAVAVDKDVRRAADVSAPDASGAPDLTNVHSAPPANISAPVAPSASAANIRTRFAPSPTGYLHIGGLRTALYGYLFAKKNGGKFILRIEDTDLERYVNGSVDVVYRTLKDAGIVYDEGPDIGGAYGPYVQSLRKDIYTEYAKRLVELGGAYYCFCGRERLDALPGGGNSDNGACGATDDTATPYGGAKKYDKHCLSLPRDEIKRRLERGEKYVIRQNMPTWGISRYKDLVFGEIAVENKELEDNVLIKADGMPTYNFANVIDDRLMGITHVMRGTEYLSSTPKYNLLYAAFGWQQPKYIHMPPIMKDASNKLSKRNGDASYEDFIKKGYLKAAIINYIALLGWSPKENREKLSMAELTELFSISGISKSPAIFDEPKLRWLNAQYIKELPQEEFCALCLPFLKKSKAFGKFDTKKILSLIQPRLEVLSDAQSAVDYLCEFSDFNSALYEHQKMKTTAELARQILPAVIKTLSALDEKNWNRQGLHDSLISLAAALDLKNGQVLFITRVAITAKETTPGGATENADILERRETIRRLKQSLKNLN